MMTHEMTPLESVKHDLWQHTDRNPVDAAAVMDTINEAVSALGDEQAPQFADRLIKSLDPYASGGLGVAGYQALEQMGDMVTDPAATRVQRWGALSLLGVIASTHNPNAHEYDTPEDPSAAFRSQVGSMAARESLARVIDSEAAEPTQRAVAQAFMGRTSTNTEDVATELMIEGLHSRTEGVRDDTAANTAIVEEVLLRLGSNIGEPRAYQLDTSQDSLRTRLDKMDWLDQSLDLGDLQGRDVYHDGTRVATIVDLTVGHRELNKLRTELEDNERHSQFWDQMAAELIRYKSTGRANRIPLPKVPTMYMSSGMDASVNIVRGYYVALGKEPGTNVDVFALVAAFCTKNPQFRVLRIISRSARRPSER